MDPIKIMAKSVAKPLNFWHPLLCCGYPTSLKATVGYSRYDGIFLLISICLESTLMQYVWFHATIASCSSVYSRISWLGDWVKVYVTANYILSHMK